MAMKTMTLAFAALLVFPLAELRAQTDSDRLEKLERAVEQLQKRNAELEDEVHGLKKRLASAPEVDANGNQKPKGGSDGKALLEKPVITEESRRCSSCSAVRRSN